MTGSSLTPTGAAKARTSTSGKVDVFIGTLEFVEEARASRFDLAISIAAEAASSMATTPIFCPRFGFLDHHLAATGLTVNTYNYEH